MRLLGLPLGAVLLLPAALALPARAATIVVDVGGSSSYATMQAGIDASTSGDTVLVLPGTYSGTGNTNVKFRGKEITLLAESGPAETTIDGQRQAKGLILDQGEGHDAIIDGFTIRNAGISSVWGSDGGGICCIGSAPTVRNCVFDDCFASGGQHMMRGWGGGIFCEHAAGARIQDCEFIHCTGLAGSGVFAGQSHVEVTRCVFRNCIGCFEAGGVCISQESGALISDCLFASCTVCPGGTAPGSLSSYQSTLVVEGCTFVESGGYSSVVWLTDLCAFRNCVVAFNSAPALACGTGSAPQISHCIVFGNAGGDSLCGVHTDNLFVDPLFCNVTGGEMTLCENSQALPQNNSWGEQVGALGEGCGDCPSAGEPRSWGSIKALYR